MDPSNQVAWGTKVQIPRPWKECDGEHEASSGAEEAVGQWCFECPLNSPSVLRPVDGTDRGHGRERGFEPRVASTNAKLRGLCT